MNEFTDRIRMEIIPELEERLKTMQKAILKSYVFTRDYKACARDNLLCGLDILIEMLDEIDEIEKQLDELEHEGER